VRTGAASLAVRASGRAPAEGLGIASSQLLPDAKFAAAWDAIILPDDMKHRLARQVATVLRMRAAGIPFENMPLHGIMLLIGPPGTGKTTFSYGLADRVATIAASLGQFVFIEVDPHALMSSSHGRSQKAVEQLFNESIAASADQGPTIVLLDEVETLAVDRDLLSLEANPVDVHRAVDAVLTSVDRLARRYPQLLFVATSNVPQKVDRAFMSRADVVFPFPLPDQAARVQILTSAVEAMVAEFPGAKGLLADGSVQRAAAEADGLDGRRLRKLVTAAVAVRAEAQADPNNLTGADLMAAVAAAEVDR
jgi:SpoVK/Ycf46/Vps4 family AAA+-type ATPase